MMKRLVSSLSKCPVSILSLRCWAVSCARLLRGKRGRWPEVIMAICTVFIAVYANAQTRIAAEQARIADRQIALLRSDQRAWVGTELQATYGQGLPLDGRVILTNFGRTPARNVRQSGKVQYERGKSRFEFAPSDSMLSAASAVGEIGAGANIHAPFRTPQLLTEQDIKDIESRIVVVYIFGKVTYKDAFDDGHYKRFAYRLYPATHEWEFLNTYNDGD